jgi:hypothetical protein
MRKDLESSSSPEAKHMMRQICKDCLPTRIRLEIIIQCQINCPLCLQTLEEIDICYLEAWNFTGLNHIIDQDFTFLTIY